MEKYKCIYQNFELNFPILNLEQNVKTFHSYFETNENWREHGIYCANIKFENEFYIVHFAFLQSFCLQTEVQIWKKKNEKKCRNYG